MPPKKRKKDAGRGGRRKTRGKGAPAPKRAKKRATSSDSSTSASSTSAYSTSSASSDSSRSPSPPPREHRVATAGVKVLPTPTKALVDTNTYKLIKLSNGIRALLIHQPPTTDLPPFCSQRRKKCQAIYQPSPLYPQTMPRKCASSKRISENAAAICVVVNAGSAADKDYRHGLAHFCEHMVHYGSEDFPEEESQIQFAMDKGKEFNAYTSAMSTGYYISLNEAMMEEGCHRMAAMLTCPIFDCNMIKREVHAVDNEFYLRKDTLPEITLLLLWSFIEIGHPIRMFPCGNLQTLLPRCDAAGVEDLREDLIDFHQRHYVGSGMTLAIQSQASLECMEEIVVKHFERIPPGDRCIRRELKIPECHKNPYQTKEFNQLYFLSGNQPEANISIFWALPPEGWQDHRRKPFEFWGSLIGDEQEGGLAFELRRQGFILDITAGVESIDFCRNAYSTVFEIILRVGYPWYLDGATTLVKTIERLLDRLYDYLGRLKGTFLQQKTTLWNEFASRNLTFEYSIPEEGVEFTDKCASALQSLPEKEIFTGVHKVSQTYEDQIMVSYLDMLTPFNMNVMVILPGKILEKIHSPELKGFKEGFEKYTETKYWGRAFPEKMLTRLDDFSKNKRLMADRPLLTFPRNLYYCGRAARLKELSCVHRDPPAVVRSNAKCLVRHYGNGGADWYLGECLVDIYSSAALFRFHQPNLCKLFLLEACVSRIVLPISGPAKKCGMLFTLHESLGSLKFQFIGFPGKLALLVGQVLRCIFPADAEDGFPRHVFDAAKADVIINLTTAMGSGKVLISSLFEEMMTFRCPPFRNTISTLSSVTYEEFLSFTKLYANCSFVHARTDGNLPIESCKDIATMINGLNYFPSIQGWDKGLHFLRPDMVRMFPYHPQILRVKSECRVDKNSVVANYYQFVGCRDAVTVLDFLQMYMRFPFFKIMRMDSQLGYNANLQLIADELKSPFIIASVVFPAHKRTLCSVDSALDMFFVQFEEMYLNGLTEAEFQEQKILWSISPDLSLQRVKYFYKNTFIEHMQPRGNNTNGQLEWTHTPGKIRKISMQVLGKNFERCKHTIANCCKTRWTKPVRERHLQPVLFSADEFDTGFQYFIRDPQWFRDGPYQS